MSPSVSRVPAAVVLLLLPEQLFRYRVLRTNASVSELVAGVDVNLDVAFRENLSSATDETMFSVCCWVLGSTLTEFNQSLSLTRDPG